MRIIALMNQKGGVGKTTTTVNLGAAIAEAGKRVCLIDMDPQAHLTINYGVEPSAEIVSLYNVLVEECSLLESLQQVEENIALVPSSIDLAAAEIELVSVLGREQILKKRIESAELDFDYVLLDCPPSLGLLTINALAVANEVIIPMQPHFLALQGVGKLLETVHLVSRRMNPGLKVSGIVLTMFDSQTKLSGEVVSDLNSFIEAAKGRPLPWAHARIFKSKIRRNIKLAESPSFGKTILRYDGTSNGAADYRALARELLAMDGVPVPTPRVVLAGEAVEERQGDKETRGQGEETQKEEVMAQETDGPATSPTTDNGPLTTDDASPAPEVTVTVTLPDPEPASAPVATPVKPPKPRKPRLAVLVTPEEAARLKAANVPEVVAKPT